MIRGTIALIKQPASHPPPPPPQWKRCRSAGKGESSGGGDGRRGDEIDVGGDIREMMMEGR